MKDLHEVFTEFKKDFPEVDANYEMLDCTPPVRQLGLERSDRVYGF